MATAATHSRRSDIAQTHNAEISCRWEQLPIVGGQLCAASTRTRAASPERSESCCTAGTSPPACPVAPWAGRAERKRLAHGEVLLLADRGRDGPEDQADDNDGPQAHVPHF
jgi:hypothetical protein